MSYFRDNIDRMAGYVPGFQPKDGDYVKLNTNENPYPPSPAVLDALRTSCGPDLRLYPDPMAELVRSAAAEINAVRPGQILCGNGADDLLNIAVRCFCREGDVLAHPYPTYGLFETLAAIQGARVVTVDFPEDFSLPPDLARTGAKLTVVCNPNAPSGTLVDADSLHELARALDGVLLIDETYVDFAEGNCLALIDGCDNVIISRSLSKSHSLAGLRLGYCIADEKIIQGMAKVKDSYNTDRLSIAGAAAALYDREWLRRNVRRIVRTRERLIGELRRMGFHCWPSQCNFVLARVPAGCDADRLHRDLFERKILVRYFKMRRLDDCLRITVGTDEQTDALLKALTDILQGPVHKTRTQDRERTVPK